MANEKKYAQYFENENNRYYFEDEKLPGLKNTVDKNTEDIQKNTSDITTANQNIQKNAGNIVTANQNITTANQNIQKNAGNIATANQNIQKNAGDIATANQNIKKNASDITTANQNIQKNAGDIATANQNIQKNVRDIAGLKTKDTTIETELSSHINNNLNPHGVTKAQIGLSNVDNVSRASILQSVYPVGSIYMSTISTSPESLFGGTWKQLKDCFLLAAGDTYAAGSTGGEAQHALTKEEMPKHRHSSSSQSAGYPSNNTDNNNYITWVNSGTQDKNDPDTGENGTVRTSWVGGSKPHNNMPPYLAVYAWKRIA